MSCGVRDISRPVRAVPMLLTHFAKHTHARGKPGSQCSNGSVTIRRHGLLGPGSTHFRFNIIFHFAGALLYSSISLEPRLSHGIHIGRPVPGFLCNSSSYLDRSVVSPIQSGMTMVATGVLSSCAIAFSQNLPPPICRAHEFDTNSSLSLYFWKLRVVYSVGRANAPFG